MIMGIVLLVLVESARVSVAARDYIDGDPLVILVVAVLDEASALSVFDCNICADEVTPLISGGASS